MSFAFGFVKIHVFTGQLFTDCNILTIIKRSKFKLLGGLKKLFNRVVIFSLHCTILFKNVFTGIIVCEIQYKKNLTVFLSWPLLLLVSFHDYY